jgi:serine/arginine repetitive matrix protein 1
VDVEVGSVATIAEEGIEEAEDGAGILIVEHHDEVLDHHRTFHDPNQKEPTLTCAGDGDLHHPAVSETSMFPVAAVVEVAGEEAAATDLVSVVALLRAVVPLLHHLVALDAHPLQIAQELRCVDEHEDRLRLAVPDHHHPVVHDALHLSTRGLHHHDGDGISLGHQATIAEGYPEIPRALYPQQRKTSQAHHHPECLDRVHERHRVAVDDLLAAHAALSESAGADTHHLKLILTALELISRNASVRSV